MHLRINIWIGIWKSVPKQASLTITLLQLLEKIDRIEFEPKHLIEIAAEGSAPKWSIRCQLTMLHSVTTRYNITAYQIRCHLMTLSFYFNLCFRAQKSILWRVFCVILPWRGKWSPSISHLDWFLIFILWLFWSCKGCLHGNTVSINHDFFRFLLVKVS